MNTNSEMRRITEVKQGASGGFQVRFYSPQTINQWFPMGDDREAALKKAKTWRNSREREFGITSSDYGVRRPRKRHGNSKADTGVFVAIGYKGDRFYADVMGVLNYTDETGKSKRKQKAHSILKHGYHTAYLLALKDRCEMAGLPLPKEVTIPKLSSDQIDKLRQEGATLKSLTEKATVPWTGVLA
jgi:hypothetical protein